VSPATLADVGDRTPTEIMLYPATPPIKPPTEPTLKGLCWPSTGGTAIELLAAEDDDPEADVTLILGAAGVREPLELPVA